MRPLPAALAALTLLTLPACRSLPAGAPPQSPSAALLPAPGGSPTPSGTPSRTAITPLPSGQVATPLRAALPDLHAAQFPVYLPDRLPASPPGSSYLISAHATADTYEVTVHFTDRPTPVNDTGMSSWSSYIGLVRGGTAAWVRQQAEAQDGLALTPPRGTPRAVALGGDRPATLYPAGAVLWQQGAWRYAVYADTAADAMRLAAGLEAGFGPSGNPVAPGTSGEAVRWFGADGGNSAVMWTAGDLAYEVWGRDANAFTLVRDLVRVQT